MSILNSIKIIKPNDWHVHLREGNMMEAVIKCSSRVNYHCIVMPNLKSPITLSQQAIDYKRKINSLSLDDDFNPLIPCYLTEKMDLKDFKFAIENKIFVGAKLYPSNATTNSKSGISNIDKIFPSLEILTDLKRPLLIHGEKIGEDIDIFDREKYFVDDELDTIRRKFPELKIVLEHVSSKYGADYVNSNNNIAGTITLQHMMLTKEDVFFDDSINPHLFCMPVVKTDQDRLALREYACSGNNKFFLGTDSAPHHIIDKIPNKFSKPGIFSSPCSIEVYTSIFDEENSLHNLEKFSSINGALFYDLPISSKFINLEKESWKLPEFTLFKDISVKNFMGGEEIKWKVLR